MLGADAVHDYGRAQAVVGALPPGPRAHHAEAGAVVNFGKGPGFVLPVVVAEAREKPHVLADFLLGVETKPHFGVAGPAHGFHVGARAGGLGHGNGAAVGGHRRHVAEAQRPHRARPPAQFVALGQLQGFGVGAAVVKIQHRTVGQGRHQGGCQAQGKIGGHVFEHSARRVAAGVGGVVPATGAHQAPVEELGARVVRVAVLVKVVGNADFAQVHGEVAPGPGAGQLVYVILLRVGTGTQGKDLAQVQTGEVERGRRVADAEGFPVGEASDAPRAAQAAATGHFGVEIQGCPLPQAPPNEERGRE